MIKNEELKREYYFTDEDNTFIKIINSISKIVGYYVIIDGLVCMLVIPGIIVGISSGSDTFSMSGTDAISYLKILGIYTIVALFLSALIDKIAHNKVYVREGDTFYIIRSSVAIDNHTKLRPSKSPDDPPGYADPYDIFNGDTDAFIHSNYIEAIQNIDNLIAKRSKRVKVISNCTAECEVTNGIKYSGLNEETMATEYFVFPTHRYLKYDSKRNYFSEDLNSIIIIWFVKCLLYFAILLLMCRIGVTNARIENQAKNAFIQEKLEELSPYGLEYDEIVNKYSADIEFTDESNSKFYNSVSYSVIITDYSNISEDWIHIDYDMSFEEGTNEIYDIIGAALHGDNIEQSILDSKIDKFRQTGINEDTEYFHGKNGTIYVTIRVSDYEDYHISVMQKVDSK